MKTFIKAYVLSALFLVALTTEANAQSKRGKEVKIVSKTKNINKKIPRTNVTYKKQTKKVVSLRNVPNKTIVKHNGQKYYYSNNKYYTYSGGRYIPIAPKVGFSLKILPKNTKRVYHNNRNYYIINGMFYTQINNQYEVVEPEIGTIVYELPSDYEKVTYNGETYYEYANILYEKIQVNGTRAYEVVGIIDMQ